MIIISGGNEYRFNSKINHQNYANHHSIEYKNYTGIQFDQGLIEVPHYIKIYSILDALKTHNEVMWIDDDAFFVNFNWDCRSIFELSDKPFILNKGWAVKAFSPMFNSGVMFIRKNDAVIKMLEEIPHITRDELRDAWKPTEWGRGKGNDQPRLIYLTQTKYKELLEVMDNYKHKFNNKPSHAMHSGANIVHFAGSQSRKHPAIDHFQKVIQADLSKPIKCDFIHGRRARYTNF